MTRIISSSGSPRFGIVLALLLAWIVPLWGGAEIGQFAAGIDLVEVYATVMDADGNVVDGLARDDFAVTEDGIPQTIATFAAGDFPLALAIGIDRSFSMGKERLRDVVGSVREFINSLRPEDQIILMAIGSENEVVVPLASSRESAIAALDRLEPWGTTPLYDAVVTSLDTIASLRGRRALILLSDGADRYSVVTAAEAVEQARRKDVLIYPVTLGGARPPIFAELSTVTGGRSLQASDRRALERAFAAIGRELKSQYLLGYASAPAAADGARWHAIQVSVKRPNVRVRARDGYYSR